jgi:hypothetical protein
LRAVTNYPTYGPHTLAPTVKLPPGGKGWSYSEKGASELPFVNPTLEPLSLTLTDPPPDPDPGSGGIGVESFPRVQRAATGNQTGLLLQSHLCPLVLGLVG